METNRSKVNDDDFPLFLRGSGEMKELIRHYNWANTPLGPPQYWHPVLKSTLSTMLQCPFPMFLFWGEELIQFYNDAYRPSLGKEGKHPTALGQRGKDCWQEIWTTIGPHLQQVMQDEGAIWQENQLIPIYRNGRIEDVYWSFSNSALMDENDKILGVLVICTETTNSVLAYQENEKTIEELRLSKERLEQAYEQVRLSKQAAQLGLFDMDLKLGTMEWDARCRELFGISHNNTVTYENDFLPGLHPEDRERVSKLIDNLFIREISNGDYDVEYKTVGTEDGKVRWVRAKGKVFFNEADEPVRFIGSVLDITDLKKEEERKNAFIGVVSHELKTPLTTIKAYIQMMKQKADGKKDDFEIRALEKTEIQLVKMSSMIDGFLNLSRLEAGKITLNTERFVLKELIEEIISETSITVITHVITLHLCEVFYVTADRIKIGNVISNLLSNAVKYSAKGKQIDIRCVQVENMAQVSIRDEGIGIKPQDKERIFNRFYRVQSSITQNISGFGIGLYLSAEIVERHGGKIWVESEEGVGSTFYFTLPLA